MRVRTVAIECGVNRSVIGVFIPTTDGELMLVEYALLPRSEERAGAVWPELPAPLRGAARFAASPPPNLTLAKTIAVPAFARAKRARVVRFEAEQAIPRPMAEVVWSWRQIADAAGKVELAAMKLDDAEALSAAAEAGGVRLDAIVPRAAALAEALRFNYPELRGPVAIAEIEGATALLVLVGGGRSAVRLIGLPEYAPVVAGEMTATNGEGGNDPRLRRLAAEVRRLGETDATPGDGAGIGVLFVAGADAPDREECARALGRNGPKVERFDALRRVRLGKDASGAAALAQQFGAVVGTALAARGCGALNLLPPRRRQANAFRRNRVWWLAAAVTFAVTVWTAALGLRQAAGRAQAESAELRLKMEPWPAAQREAQECQRKLDACKRELAVIEGLERAQPSWAAWLGDAEQRLVHADGVWLESLRMAKGAGGGAAPGGLFGGTKYPNAGDGVARLRIEVTGCALDPGPDGRRGLDRVRGLLGDWAKADSVAAVEAERFDSSEAGLLRFGCMLVLKPEAGL